MFTRKIHLRLLISPAYFHSLPVHQLPASTRVCRPVANRALLSRASQCAPATSLWTTAATRATATGAASGINKQKVPALLLPYTDMTHNLTYNVATQNDQEKIVTFLCDNFLKDEPTSAALGMDSTNSSRLMNDIVSYCLSFDASFTVTDAATGQLAAIRINSIEKRKDTIIEDPIPDDYTQPERFICNYLNAIDRKSLPHLPAQIQKYLKVNITSVRKDFMRKGIASHLVELTLDAARRHECQAIYTQATSHKSQSLYVKLGWHTLGTVEHKDYDGSIQCRDECNTHKGVGMYRLL